MRARFVGGAHNRGFAMSGASGERGVTRGRGRGRGGRGRGWRDGERDRRSWGEVFAVGPDPGLRGSFPRPPGRGGGVVLWPFLQPGHMPGWFPGPQWYPGRGRGFVQPPHFPPPAFAPTLYPSAPPRHPSTPPGHPSTPPRHPTPHRRGNPLLQRPWETINEPEQVGQTPPTILTAMTYNVLAQSLIDKNMHLYRNTEALCWESRRQLLLRELREARADIVCLQEVEDEHYHNWFLPNMSSLGYGGLYKKRTGEHTDGCAVFYNSSQLKLLDWRPVEFQKRVKVLDRDNVGLVAKFEIPVSGQRSAAFCLATTHLLFNPKAGEVKLAQMVCLLAELDRLATPPSGEPRLACIMCGDLNSLPSSPLLRFLENGLLAISGLKRDQVAGYHFRDSSQRESIPVPLLPLEVPISQECRLLSASDDNHARPGIDSHLFHGTIFLSAYFSPSPSRHRSSRRPASGDGCSNHPSSDATATSAQPSPPAQSFTGVHSARPTSVGSPKSVTTYHMKAIEMVDYIHYTPTTFLTTPSDRRSPFNQEDYRQPGFCLLGRRSLISPGSLRKMGPQPHSLLPSDHLWLLARLQFFPGPPHTH